jgi:tol-pal system protein YbgF
MAFEQILRDFPNDPRGPDAQFGLAETYAGEGVHERAIEELLKVESQWPRSPRAPQALLRAGILAKDNGDASRARELLRQVGERYPSSPERQVAEQQLRSIR